MSEVADLSPNVANQLMASAMGAHTVAMSEGTNNSGFSNNLLRLVAAKKLDQVDSLEAQANRAVTNTPIGSPTTGS
tara:strand:- start:699 stop:926 length:228 start_codon:yes stop_codon:yes gene_type:complete